MVKDCGDEKLAKIFATLAKGDVAQLMKDQQKGELAGRGDALVRVYSTFNKMVDKAKALTPPKEEKKKEKPKTKADLDPKTVEPVQGDVVDHACFKNNKRVNKAKFCHNCKDRGGDNLRWTFEVVDKETKIKLGEITVQYDIGSKYPNETGQSKAINKLAQDSIKKLKVADLLK
ncbi:MAG: hypothetical protein AAFR79_03695 [Pseudomonadota bacterium]